MHIFIWKATSERSARAEVFESYVNAQIYVDHMVVKDLPDEVIEKLDGVWQDVNVIEAVRFLRTD